jgi:hypothetical protein
MASNRLASIDERAEIVLASAQTALAAGAAGLEHHQDDDSDKESG